MYIYELKELKYEWELAMYGVGGSDGAECRSCEVIGLWWQCWLRVGVVEWQSGGGSALLMSVCKVSMNFLSKLVIDLGSQN